MAKGKIYPSDLTDGQWAILEPLIPPEIGGGRHRATWLLVADVTQGLPALPNGVRVLPQLATRRNHRKDPQHIAGRGTTATGQGSSTHGGIS